MNVEIIGHSAFEHMVKEEFGRDYEYPYTEEVSNDTCKKYLIDGKLTDYEQKKLNNFKEGKDPSYIGNTLLNYLCQKGKIDPGTIIIDVSW
jgi:hypothetical protein